MQGIVLFKFDANDWYQLIWWVSLMYDVMMSFFFLLWPAGGRGEAETGDMDSRRNTRYPDSHQLFVGNLPHDIDESELKEFFMSMFSRKATLCPYPEKFSIDCRKYQLNYLISFYSCSIWKCRGAADQHKGRWWEAAQLRICGLWWLRARSKNLGGQGRRGMY